MSNRKIYDDLDQLSMAVGQEIADLSNAANQKGRPFSIALSGGSTPKRLYEKLAQPPLVDTISWGGVKIFFGDERSVPPDDTQSNFLMAKTALFDQLPIPSENIHRIQGELKDHHQAATLYQEALSESLDRNEQGIPIFDLVLLGIGTDGHIASLFPGTPLLSETKKYVGAVYVPKLHTWRLSITYPVINNAKNIFILAAGEDKQSILKNVLSNGHQEPIYPVQRIQPRGQLTWYLDKKAAAQLTP